MRKCNDEDIFITKNDKVVAKLVSCKDSRFNDLADGGNLLVAQSSAAYNYPRKKITYEEFIAITEGSEERYELIEGEIYLLTSPGVIRFNTRFSLSVK